MGAPLAIVTSNPSKGEEARAILGRLGIEAEVVAMEKLEIQSESLEEIALFAARRAYERLKRAVVVDDSGLFVRSLNGFPGPYSNYVYKKIGISGLLKLMEGVSDRSASFVTALALVSDLGEEVFVGEVRGLITTSPRGSRGFGFDPIFQPEGSDKTYAEMGDEKNEISHRAKAYEALARGSRILKALGLARDISIIVSENNGSHGEK